MAAALELDDDLAGARHRVRAVAVRERPALDDRNGFHRSDAQGSSAETSTAT